MLSKSSKFAGLSRNHRNRSYELFTAEEFSALRKKDDKSVALRLGHLWACAVELATVNPGASRTLGSQLLDLSITSGVALPRSRAAVSPRAWCRVRHPPQSAPPLPELSTHAMVVNHFICRTGDLPQVWSSATSRRRVHDSSSAAQFPFPRCGLCRREEAGRPGPKAQGRGTRELVRWLVGGSGAARVGRYGVSFVVPARASSCSFTSHLASCQVSTLF